MSLDPKDRGEFAIRPGRGPVQYVKEGKEIKARTVRQPSYEEELDMLLVGVPRTGRPSGFARWAALQPPLEREAAAGAGPYETKPQRSGHGYDATYDVGAGGSDGISEVEMTSERPGHDDLMGQPATRDRKEYGDLVSDEDLYESRVRQDSSGLTPDDIWSRDLFEDFDEDRHEEPESVDRPTFSGEPHRQTEASLDDELADVFNDVGETFRRRGL